MKLLETKEITKQFDNKKIIEDINIHIDSGEIVSLLGVSGVGKTTLFNIIAGVITPDEGAVLLNGSNINGISGQISYMLQKDLLLAHMNICDNHPRKA